MNQNYTVNFWKYESDYKHCINFKPLSFVFRMFTKKESYKKTLLSTLYIGFSHLIIKICMSIEGSKLL